MKRTTSKGERTRQRAIARAAEVFSLYGYAGTSMGELRKATELPGGIYGHFESKEALALEAFDYAIALVRQRASEAYGSKRSACEQLQAIIDVFRSLIEDPLLPGGCPILNTAVEADDAYPVLRTRVQEAMAEWHTRIIRAVTEGVQRGELRPETDPQDVAAVLTAALEGAVMLSKLFGDTIYMHRVVAHLSSYVQTLEVPAKRTS